MPINHHINIMIIITKRMIIQTDKKKITMVTSISTSSSQNLVKIVVFHIKSTIIARFF